jgi:hypothetical protein
MSPGSKPQHPEIAPKRRTEAVEGLEIIRFEPHGLTETGSRFVSRFLYQQSGAQVVVRHRILWSQIQRSAVTSLGFLCLSLIEQ